MIAPPPPLIVDFFEILARTEYRRARGERCLFLQKIDPPFQRSVHTSNQYGRLEKVVRGIPCRQEGLRINGFDKLKDDTQACQRVFLSGPVELYGGFFRVKDGICA